MQRKRTEVRCPKCNEAHCSSYGGFITKVENKFVRRLYRHCPDCNFKFVTDKDIETGNVYFEGKRLERVYDKK